MKMLEDVPAVQKIRRPRSSAKPRIASKAPTKTARKRVQATVVTPRLHALCSDLFPLNKFEVCGYPSQDEPSPEVEEDYPTHEGDLQTVVWVKKSTIRPYHYREAIIDGVHYTVGSQQICVISTCLFSLLIRV